MQKWCEVILYFIPFLRLYYHYAIKLKREFQSPLLWCFLLQRYNGKG